MKKIQNKNDIIYKEFNKNQIGMLAQTIFTLYVIVFGIAGLYQKALMPIFEILMGVTLLVMTYNNHIIYKKKVFTIPYVVGALIAFYTAITTLL